MIEGHTYKTYYISVIPAQAVEPVINSGEIETIAGPNFSEKLGTAVILVHISNPDLWKVRKLFDVFNSQEGHRATDGMLPRLGSRRGNETRETLTCVQPIARDLR